MLYLRHGIVHLVALYVSSTIGYGARYRTPQVTPLSENMVHLYRTKHVSCVERATVYTSRGEVCTIYPRFHFRVYYSTRTSGYALYSMLLTNA